jgi:hypothetical protein
MIMTVMMMMMILNRMDVMKIEKLQQGLAFLYYEIDGDDDVNDDDDDDTEQDGRDEE